MNSTRRETFHVRTLDNGLVLLGQPMDHVQSVAMAIALPMGAADDPDGLEGASAVAAEWCFRGAGERDTRALNDALDTLGCRHNERVRGEYLALSAGLLGKNLPAVLEIYADILRRPRWETAAFETCRMLVAQDLAALADEPSRQAMTLLTERFYPAPLGRCVYGTPAGLETLTAGSVREHASRRMAATGTVLALAGRFDWDAAVALVERLLGDWSGPQPAAPRVSEPPTGPAHLARPTAQTHIALAHRAPLMGQEHYYPFRVGEEILGGGMSGRLFTEVREKRGLVYGISTRYHTLRGHAGLMLYAGTRPEHAQETYDVTLGELRRIRDGIDEDELARARVQLRSSLVMQGESTLARAGALVSDWHLAGRLRTLEEIASAIEAVTREQVLEALTAYPPAEMTALVLGPDPIELGC